MLDILDGTLWHSTNSLYLPLRKPKTWQPRNIFNNYRSNIISHDRHCGLGWEFAATARSWMRSTKMYHPALGAIGEISTPEKKKANNTEKGYGRPWKFIRGSREVFIILAMVLYWYWHRFQRAVRKNGDTSRVIPCRWQAVYKSTSVNWNKMHTSRIRLLKTLASRDPQIDKEETLIRHFCVKSITNRGLLLSPKFLFNYRQLNAQVNLSISITGLFQRKVWLMRTMNTHVTLCVRGECTIYATSLLP